MKQFAVKYPQNPMEIISGDGNVLLLSNTPIRHEYVVYAKSTLRLRESTLYFPGWTLRVNNKLQEINYKERKYEGQIVFRLNPGLYHIILTFDDTPVRFYLKIISGTALGLIFVMIFIVKFFKIGYFKRLR